MTIDKDARKMEADVEQREILQDNTSGENIDILQGLSQRRAE